MREVRLAHYGLVRCANQHRADEEDIVGVRAGEPGKEPGIDREGDAVWLSHRRDLMQAAKLLRSLPTLSARKRKKLTTTMRRVGRSVGLDGPWRVFDTPAGDVRLAYIIWWEDNGPDMADCFQCCDIEVDFRGGCIDGLPEARYLGRLVQKVAGAYAGQPWREGGVQD